MSQNLDANLEKFDKLIDNIYIRILSMDDESVCRSFNRIGIDNSMIYNEHCNTLKMPEVEVKRRLLFKKELQEELRLDWGTHELAYYLKLPSELAALYLTRLPFNDLLEMISILKAEYSKYINGRLANYAAEWFNISILSKAEEELVKRYVYCVWTRDEGSNNVPLMLNEIEEFAGKEGRRLAEKEIDIYLDL